MTVPLTAGQTGLIRHLPTVASALLLPPLIYLGNPAIALLAAACFSLTLNRPALPAVILPWGKYGLQAAIVLLGLRLDAAEMMALSADYALLIGGFVILTLGAGLLLGRLLTSDTACSQLIAAGTAICGGTAVASLAPVIRARSEQTAMVVALIFLLNAVALLVFPWVGEALGLSQRQFGLWAAIAIHDTSSVVATAAIYGDEAARVATTLKLGRTLWLIPLLLVASVMMRAPQAKLRIPGFIGLFIAASAFGSIVPLPAVVPEVAGMVSKALLVCALFCIGAELNRATVASLRGRVLAQGLLLWALVIPLSLMAAIHLA